MIVLIMSFLSLEIICIIPLYMGWDKNGTFYVASELKALKKGFAPRLNYFLPDTTGLVKIMHLQDGIIEIG